MMDLSRCSNTVTFDPVLLELLTSLLHPSFFLEGEVFHVPRVSKSCHHRHHCTAQWSQLEREIIRLHQTL